MSNIIYYHKDCHDGFCAAWVASKHFNLADTIYIPVQYGDQGIGKDVTQHDFVYFLDFSLPREQLLELNDRCNALVVLDHHVSAQQDLDGLSFCFFDMNHSGAFLTHWYFDGNHVVPWLVLDVEDRDLWRFSREGSNSVHAALKSYPMRFDVWDNLAAGDRQKLIAEGQTIRRMIDVDVERACAKVKTIEIAGYTVPYAENVANRSEVMQTLLRLFPSAPFAAVVYVHLDGLKVWTIRSRQDGFDCATFAKQYGGGGHYNAAGWHVDPGVDRLY